MDLTVWLPELETASLLSWPPHPFTPGRNLGLKVLDTDPSSVWTPVRFQVTIHGEHLSCSLNCWSLLSQPQPCPPGWQCPGPTIETEKGPDKHFQAFPAWGLVSQSWPRSPRACLLLDKKGCEETHSPQEDYCLATHDKTSSHILWPGHVTSTTKCEESGSEQTRSSPRLWLLSTHDNKSLWFQIPFIKLHSLQKKYPIWATTFTEKLLNNWEGMVKTKETDEGSSFHN